MNRVIRTPTLTHQAEKLSAVYQDARRRHRPTKVLGQKLLELRTRALKAENRRKAA